MRGRRVPILASRTTRSHRGRVLLFTPQPVTYILPTRQKGGGCVEPVVAELAPRWRTTCSVLHNEGTLPHTRVPSFTHTYTVRVPDCSVDVWSNRMEGEAHDSSVGSRIACLWRYTAYSITSRGAIGKLI